MPRDPCEPGGDQAAGHVADTLQPPAPVERDELGHQHLERYPLRTAEEAQQEERGERDDQQRRAFEHPCGEGEHQHHHAHHRTDGDRIGQDALAALDLGTRQDRRDRTAQLQQRGAEADCGGAAGQQIEIGGNDRGRIDQAEAGHPEHAMRQIGRVIAPEVVLHESTMAPPDIGVRERLRCFA